MIFFFFLEIRKINKFNRKNAEVCKVLTHTPAGASNSPDSCMPTTREVEEKTRTFTIKPKIISNQRRMKRFT